MRATKEMRRIIMITERIQDKITSVGFVIQTFCGEQHDGEDKEREEGESDKNLDGGQKRENEMERRESTTTTTQKFAC